MKLVFENFEHITDAYKDQYAEAVRRASAFMENLTSVENYAGSKGLLTVDSIDTITVDGKDYPDEFYVDTTHLINPKGSVHDGHEKYLHVEILTAESAERNERDEMDCSYTDEERANYKLGETVQRYSPLGNSGYWYTLK